jgi:fatty acid desaturase
LQLVPQYLGKEELRELLRTSNAQGFLALGASWGLILAAFVLYVRFPTVSTFLLSSVLIGGRQLALGILMHDCAHRSLFRSRRLNDWVGAWFCAYPTWQDLSRYRPHHLRHHALAGTEKDPDLALVTAYPTEPRSLARKFLRDLSGVTFLRRVVGLLMMDAGYIEYTVAGELKPVPRARSRSYGEVVRTFLVNFGPVALSNSVLLGFLWWSGHPELYGLWIFSWAIFFSVFVRVRSIAEHACTEMRPEPPLHTRTTRAGMLARFTVAPHHVNFHLEHHLLMLVPQHRLKQFHGLLWDRGFYERTSAYFELGYLRVLRRAMMG